MNHARVPFFQLYRINALRALGGLAFGLLSVTAAPPVAPLGGIVFDVLGTLAIFVAMAGRAWSLLYIGGRKNAELVTEGPYSVTRNPLYFFSLIGIAGIGAQSGSILSMAAFLLTAYLAFDMAMRGEETYLRSRYGKDFNDYARSVPRLWPDISLWRECDGLPLRSSSAVRSLRDSVVFLAAWAAIGIIRLGQSAGILPVLWTLPV
ncbi:isoprenylcysteine carboxylmethyltransferase family protein [Bradyrhizobium sp. BRP14]|nr:isoprenylcysteine carboxylmethyltransferase family protein [Bradyrhizobium sp. BRP14]